MKRILLIILGLIISNSIIAQNSDSNSIDCPEQSISDLVYINYFLSDPKFEDKKQRLDVSLTRAKSSEHITQNLDGLQNYLENRGVRLVSNDNSCARINTELQDNFDKIEEYDSTYRKTFFSIKEHYAVLFIPNNKSDRSGGWPLVLMNKNYEILDEYIIN